jgi:hypothetical protein
MIASFITYATDTEPYKSMAQRLKDSIHDAKAGVCHVIELEPNGSNLFAEALGRGYKIMSDFIDEGPVILIDADCFVWKPIDHLFDKEFSLAAVHRGECSNQMGNQSFLSTVVCFHPRDPNIARYLWLWWAERTMLLATIEPQVEKEKVRNALLAKLGWLANWYCDQTALNEILHAREAASPLEVLRLARNKYAAAPGTKDAYIWHAKGKGKLTCSSS